LEEEKGSGELEKGAELARQGSGN